MHSWRPSWLPDGPSLILWMTQCPRNRRKNGLVKRRERKRSGGLPPRHSGRPIILQEHSRSDRTHSASVCSHELKRNLRKKKRVARPEYSVWMFLMRGLASSRVCEKDRWTSDNHATFFSFLPVNRIWRWLCFNLSRIIRCNRINFIAVQILLHIRRTISQEIRQTIYWTICSLIKNFTLKLYFKFYFKVK